MIDLPSQARVGPAAPAAPPAGADAAGPADPVDPVALIAGRVEHRIRTLLAGRRAAWAAEQPVLAEMFDALDDFVAAGGKRLRPAFCYWGAVASGASGDEPGLVDACAALELLHAFALLHDDVMDGSATRRGRPAVHERFAGRHAAAGWAGESRRHGEGLAVLVGDLAFALADGLLDHLPPVARGVWHDLRVELVAGQWVDLVAAASTDRSPAVARWVARYKSGRYTVERPLQLGAAVAGDDRTRAVWSAFGEPLGRAFQLRDDVLGVFGDPGETGKPAGDDLREGKPTLLLAMAAAHATDGERRLLARVGAPDLGDDEVAEIRAAIGRCGALALVESEIERLVARSERALDAVDPVTARQLHALAERATVRTR